MTGSSARVRGAHGHEIDAQGDAHFLAFAQARDAVAAAAQLQRGLAAEAWPAESDIRVRVGLHTGDAARSDGRYVGLSIHRAARICTAAHGGQVLLLERDARDPRGRRPGGDLVPRPRPLAAQGLRPPRAALPARRPRPRAATSRASARPRLRGSRRGLARRSPLRWWRSPRRRPGSCCSPRGSGRTTPTPSSMRTRWGSSTRSRPLLAQPATGASPSRVVAGRDAVWVTNADGGTVTRLDRATRAARRRSRSAARPPASRSRTGPRGSPTRRTARWRGSRPTRTAWCTGRGSGIDPTGVAATPGAVWVANSGARSIQRIDPATGSAGAPIDVGAAPTDWPPVPAHCG